MRYWLYSVPMSDDLIANVQHDADQIWWSKDPTLKTNAKFRRPQKQETLIGPRTQGGLGVMDWLSHVKAFRAQWILKYLHPADSAWKRVLDEFLLSDGKGGLKYGIERAILLCPLKAPEKKRLREHIPQN